jgi:IMP dehydrogenase
MLEDRITEGLAFDDVLLVPAKSDILPGETDITTSLSRNIRLNIPLVSAAMDTVTESRLAIAMAQQGGIGIVHKNMPIRKQADQVDKVKRSESGMIVDPITMPPDGRISEALKLMKDFRISGVPVISREGKLLGILTNRDLRFETRLSLKVSDVMTSKNLITVPVGTTLEEAQKILHKHKVEKLLVVDDDFNLKGLITVKDIQKTLKYPNACKDGLGRLRIGAALGTTPDTAERAAALVEAHVDILVIDTAHGHSDRVFKTVKAVKKSFPGVELIAGNIATEEAAEALIDLGVDGIKVGIGPSAICTTRVISGVGVPQISAIVNCSRAAKKHGVPLIADGGVKYSGDITKALAAGGDSVMIGSLFAGTHESPGERILYQGRAFKSYRGMGSLAAMKAGSSDRYGQADEEDSKKLVPEGIEGIVPYKGKLSDTVFQLVGGLRAGMGYCGCQTIKDLQSNSRFVKISSLALKESHVHDVVITKEAPNYHISD